MDDVMTTPHLQLSEEALVALLREQPSVGVAALYDCYGRLVFSMALRVVQDRGVAEEITQDVFLRCWHSIERFKPDQGSLVSWVLSITHHRAIDELRSRRNKATRREVFDTTLAPPVFDPALDETLLRDEVEQLLNALPSNQRTVIELLFWDGFSRREIADRLQLPLGTVHTRLRLGMEKLREACSRLFDGP